MHDQVPYGRDEGELVPGFGLINPRVTPVDGISALRHQARFGAESKMMMKPHRAMQARPKGRPAGPKRVIAEPSSGGPTIPPSV